MSKRIPKTIISFEHNYYLDEDVFKMVNKLEQENKQLKEKIDILLEDNNQLEEIRIKAIEYIEQLPFNDLTPLEVKVIYKILGEKENDNNR